MKILRVVFFIIISLFLLDQVGRWMERKGWIYYKKKGSTGSAGALLEFSSIMNPGAKKTIELSEKDAKERDGQGDDVEPLELKF